MYTITAMNTQKRNKNRVNVFLDGRFAFGLSIGQPRDLSVGQTITKPEVSLLRSVDEVENARDRLFDFSPIDRVRSRKCALGWRGMVWGEKRYRE